MEHRPDWIPLVEAARRGERPAQGELLSRFEPLTRSTARRLVPPNLVDDVVQQSHITALRSISKLRTPGAFPSWLRLIIRKQAAHVRAGQMPVAGRAAAEPVDAAPGPEQEALRAEVASLVRSALAAAGDEDRRMLELRYLNGWSNRELAELLGIGTGTVRKRLHDARRRLRPTLRDLEPEELTMSRYQPLLGAVHDTTVAVTEPPALRPPPPARTVTGLKVIDVFAPLRRGGTIEMRGPAGTGQIVVTLELLYRLGRAEGEVACVGVGRAGVAIGSQPDIAHIVTEAGLPGPNTTVLAAHPDESPRAFAIGARIAAGLASEGSDVILAVDRPTLDHVTSGHLSSAAGLGAAGSVTVVAINLGDRDTDPVEPLGLDATLVFSAEHIAQGISPAIDGSRSTSMLEISEAAAATKQRLADADRLRRWCNQALFVARDHTGEDGDWIEPDIADMELAGMIG